MTKRYVISVPENDKATQAWFEAQDVLSVSLRCVIRDKVRDDGICDYFAQIPEAKPKRQKRKNKSTEKQVEAPSSVKEPVALNVEAKVPEHYAEKPKPVVKSAASQMVLSTPKPKKKQETTRLTSEKVAAEGALPVIHKNTKAEVHETRKETETQKPKDVDLKAAEAINDDILASLDA